jgi:prolyl oligopeptidase
MSRLAGLLGLWLTLLPFVAADEAPRPTTAARPVADVYHGTRVVDPYRWLEKADDPEVQRWVEAQNQHTRAALDKLPHREAILQRIQKLNDSGTPEYTELCWVGGKLFGKADDRLITLRSADEPETEKLIVDPHKLAPGKRGHIEFYSPSLDGKRVAVCVSTEGRQEGTVHVYDVEAGKKLDDTLPLVSTGTLSGSLAWNADGTGFWYTRNFANGKAGQRQEVWFHKLGTPADKDAYALGKDFPPLGNAGLQSSDDGRYVLATISLGWLSEQTEHFLRGPSGEWARLGAPADRILRILLGPDGTAFLLSYRDAPRGQLLRLPAGSTQMKEAKRVVPQLDGIIYNFMPTATRLYVVELLDGSPRLRVFDYEGREQKSVPVPPLVALEEVVPLEKDVVLYRIDSYLAPTAWYRYDPDKEEGKKTELTAVQLGKDFGKYEVVREHARSKDGTKVAIDIVRPRGVKLDGNNPTWLTGYGGYAFVLVPSFDPARLVWLEQGGVYAVAHLRGDGDLGEDWARAGMRQKRQNAFDDFAACLDHLVRRKYTRPEKLAVEGGSNGGLLVGAALTQYPQKFRAAVAWAGKYDLLRSEAHPTGFTDVAELGSVRDPEQFRALHSFSPYHRVQDGKAYPAVLLLTGANDTRVNPSDSWKMAARLQAATSSKQPVLLWTEPGAGHDVRSEELDADMYAFLFHQLDVAYREIKEPQKDQPLPLCIGVLGGGLPAATAMGALP